MRYHAQPQHRIRALPNVPGIPILREIVPHGRLRPLAGWHGRLVKKARSSPRTTELRPEVMPCRHGVAVVCEALRGMANAMLGSPVRMIHMPHARIQVGI